MTDSRTTGLIKRITVRNNGTRLEKDCLTGHDLYQIVRCKHQQSILT